MLARVNVRYGLPGVHGKPVYRRGDFGLAYEAHERLSDVDETSLSKQLDQQFGMRSRNVFVMADTLTLAFSESDGCFVSLDAYTNDAQWKDASGMKPPIVGGGALVLDERIDDRVGLDVLPSYRFDRRDSTLSISFGVRSLQYFEVGDDLFVGVANGNLAEVILTNLRME
jgi:hypothetical protein